ncbi:DctQ4 [Desulforapulum autotrophicum HRM2]|uniref:DctQ4 n=1 Tax=Desulforapulum autotrophicum (strain ATCC 43914 / DSM 3382 / VKM B-1955 / HRM2) TaxID=177437 RepID=C0QDI5_DESAH|nr:TRAP transporter small permease [Desulforapulum autotrophicum]ACN15249.1 DctQ4 [Desulforapulum autotrophicum HRM2]
MKRVLAGLTTIQTLIAGTFLVVMVVLTTANIVGRQAGMPIRGTFEIMGFLGAAVFGLSLSFSHSKKEHLYVSILFDAFPRKVQQVARAVSNIASIALFSFLGVQLARTGLNLKAVNEVSETLRIPYYPVVLVLAFGVAVLVLLLVYELLTAFGESS